MELGHKYQRVADWLRKNIRAGVFKSGNKLPSEPNLCSRFSISRQTARSAIAILEKEGLVIRRQGSGTYVSDFLFSGERKKIGLLLTYANDYIFPPIISGIEEVLSKHGHMMSLSLTHNKVENERTQLSTLLSDNMDGLIVEAAKAALPSPNLHLYEELASRGIPVVFMSTYHNLTDCNYIINDDVKGGRLAVKHLVEYGHKQIGGIFKHDDHQGHQRYKGFVEELCEQGLNLIESNIVWYSTETLESLFHKEQFALLLDRLKGISAVVCYNDQVALKLIQGCIKEGIDIPKDLSIVSFDNSELSKITQVPLSSITHPGSDMGRLAARSLLEIMQDPQRRVNHIYEPKLVVRDSVWLRKKEAQK